MKNLTILIFIFLSISLTAQDTFKRNPPPRLPSGEIESFLTQPEFILSCLVLFFFIVVLMIEFFIIRMKLMESQQALKLLTVTLVIMSSIFLITASFETQEITPIIGLLGTIVGYLLGSNSFQSHSKSD